MTDAVRKGALTLVQSERLAYLLRREQSELWCLSERSERPTGEQRVAHCEHVLYVCEQTLT